MTVKKFIKENIELIDKDEWEQIYKKALSELDKGVEIGQFTKIMLDADIHPEEYMSMLPESFLEGVDITSFEIPDNITTIGAHAFAHCDSLTNITIPDSVTDIGYSAFWACDSLTSIAISNNVTSINSGTFSKCSRLTDVVIPDSVTLISDHAFTDCKSFINIIIPDRVTIIGSGAFRDCTNLESITIPASVTTIGDWAFYNIGENLTINYAGTKEDWKKIYNNLAFANTYFTVKCTDGDIIKKKR